MIMANTNFDLGLAKCRIRDSITSAKGKYFRYIVKNDFDIDDETNIYVKNFFELEEIRTKRTDNCTTEEEINNLMSRVAELKKFIIEKENENDSIKTDRITVVIDGKDKEKEFKKFTEQLNEHLNNNIKNFYRIKDVYDTDIIMQRYKQIIDESAFHFDETDKTIQSYEVKEAKEDLTEFSFDLNVKMLEKFTEEDEIKVEKGNLVEA